MPDRITIEPLRPCHVDDLALLLCDDRVYQHIGGAPSDELFRLRMTRALAGPPPSRPNELWLNYLVRRAADGAILGRLEATIQSGIAEVAFLFGAEYWGCCYATEGLHWLCRELHARPERPDIWATTVPRNRRCRSLLRRCGFTEATERRPSTLRTYDDGDLAYRGPSEI